MADIAAQSGYDYNGRRTSSSRSAQENTKETIDDLEAQINAQQNANKGAIANAKEKIGDKVAEAKDLVKDQVKNKVKQVVKKQILTIAAGLLANPVFWIVLLVIVLVIGGVLVVRKLQDETGVSFANICQTVGQENCLKTVLNQTGVGLSNSSK